MRASARLKKLYQRDLEMGVEESIITRDLDSEKAIKDIYDSLRHGGVKSIQSW